VNSCLSTRGGDADDEADVNPYLDQVPSFPAAPAPEPITLPEAKEGEVPVLHSVPTEQPVAFITIDDGHFRHPDAPLLLEAADVPVDLFLLSPVAEEDPDYFASLVERRAAIHAHTVTHLSMEDEKLDIQEAEICDSADQLETMFTERSSLFRPPYGAYDDTTLQAAANCDMDAVIHWRVTVDYGEITFQPGEDQVQPGDILLLHFREEFVEDFLVALEAIDEAGLTPVSLEDYL
jgi:peptidoglycan/xylan/chitin deacetylase (PgdA/CDA1 family)